MTAAQHRADLIDLLFLNIIEEKEKEKDKK
jgi:hypothetical protein